MHFALLAAYHSYCLSQYLNTHSTLIRPTSLLILFEYLDSCRLPTTLLPRYRHFSSHDERDSSSLGLIPETLIQNHAFDYLYHQPRRQQITAGRACLRELIAAKLKQSITSILDIANRHRSPCWERVVWIGYFLTSRAATTTFSSTLIFDNQPAHPTV